MEVEPILNAEFENAVEFLYSFVDYFLAPFGPAITLMLVALGYKVVDSFFTWREYYQRLRPIRQLKNIGERLKREITRGQDVWAEVDNSVKKLESLVKRYNGPDDPVKVLVPPVWFWSQTQSPRFFLCFGINMCVL